MDREIEVLVVDFQVKREGFKSMLTQGPREHSDLGDKSPKASFGRYGTPSSEQYGQPRSDSPPALRQVVEFGPMRRPGYQLRTAFRPARET
jgi:hypothetical protein